jgi:hypothetical protein
LVNKEGTSIQIQTEYAYRPYPRVTTTILDNGRVLHKIEKKLDKGIDSPEEQSQMEDVIKQQHSEILAIVKDNQRASAPKNQQSTTQKFEIAKEATMAQKLATIPGVEKVYHLDTNGEFVDSPEASNFKNAYPQLFKGHCKLMGLFMVLPGSEMKREQGVYEVERDSLYFVSAGKDFYFVKTARIDSATDFEKTLKEYISPDSNL